MFRIYLVTILFLMAALSGCLGKSDSTSDDDPASPLGDDTATFPGDGNETLGNMTTGEAIRWIAFPSVVEAPEPIQLSWEIDLTATGGSSARNETGDGNETGNEDEAGDDGEPSGNETGGDGNETNGNETASGGFETGVAYGTFSIAMPTLPSEYDNISGVDTNQTDAYAAEILFETNEDITLYVRAYVLSEGAYHWSEELTILVNATASIEHEITIGAGTIPLAQFSVFSPRNIEIAAGDSVVWNNTAPGSHTIQITGPEEHTTGAISSGEASEPIQLLEPGEYAYECTTHDTMNGGTITVTGPGEEETE